MALSPLLVDAKREYTHQLADVMAPYVFNTVARMFDRAKKQHPAFRDMLRQVPNWNSHSIGERANEIERRNPQLQDLIAACCVSYTKVLGSIRLSQSQTSNFRVALPESTVFVHGVYVHVAKEFFYDPKLVFADRHVKIELMRAAVEESVRQHVPIKDLLKAYLSVAVDVGGLDPLAIPSVDMYENQPLSQPQSPGFDHAEQPMMQQQQQQQQMMQPMFQPVQQPMFQPVQLQPAVIQAPVQMQQVQPVQQVQQMQQVQPVQQQQMQQVQQVQVPQQLQDQVDQEFGQEFDQQPEQLQNDVDFQ